MESRIIYQKARYQESPEETFEYKKGGTKKIMLKNQNIKKMRYQENQEK